MTVLQTAYNTTACRDFQMAKTTAAILVAFSHGQLTALDKSQDIYLIQGGASVADAIPAFAHPLVVKVDQREILVVDVRAYGKWDNAQWRFMVRDAVSYALAIHRARLTAIWRKENPTILRDISQVPLMAYSMWVSEAVAKRFALDPRQQLNLAILAAIFYCSQFNEEPVDETDMRMVNQISRALKASAQDVVAVVEKVPSCNSVVGFCNMAEEVTGSIRMKELKVGVLFAVLGGTWFGGSEAREMACVAIEHPPTWIAILMQAISERSYKNSAIAKITERSAFRESGQAMLRSVLNLESSIEH